MSKIYILAKLRTPIAFVILCQFRANVRGRERALLLICDFRDLNACVFSHASFPLLWYARLAGLGVITIFWYIFIRPESFSSLVRFRDPLWGTWLCLPFSVTHSLSELCFGYGHQLWGYGDEQKAIRPPRKRRTWSYRVEQNSAGGPQLSWPFQFTNVLRQASHLCLGRAMYSEEK